MARPTSPSGVKTVEPADAGPQLSLKLSTDANGSKFDIQTRRQCNIIIVPGIVTNDVSAAKGRRSDDTWPWLDFQDGPAAMLARYLATQNTKSKVYLYNYDIPSSQYGITVETMRQVSRELLQAATQILAVDDDSNLREMVDYPKDDTGSDEDHVANPDGEIGLDDGRDSPTRDTGTEAKPETDGGNRRASGTLNEVGDRSATATSIDADGMASPESKSGLDATLGEGSIDPGTRRPEPNSTGQSNPVEDSDTDDGDHDDASANGSSKASEAQNDSSLQIDDEEDDVDDESDDIDDENDDVDIQEFVFVGHGVGGVVVKEALSQARKTMTKYQRIAACTTLLLFYETPTLSAVDGLTWDDLAHYVLFKATGMMFFSDTSIKTTVAMIKAVFEEFFLSETIYSVVNVRCSGKTISSTYFDVSPSKAPSPAFIEYLGDMILGPRKTPKDFFYCLNTLSLTMKGFPRVSIDASSFDPATDNPMTDLNGLEKNLESWTSNVGSSGLFSYHSYCRSEAYTTFRCLLKRADAICKDTSLRNINDLEELLPTTANSGGHAVTRSFDTDLCGRSSTTVIYYTFGQYSEAVDEVAACLASLCYQLICKRRSAFKHANLLINCLHDRSFELIWPADKLLTLFQSLMVCSKEPMVFCIIHGILPSSIPEAFMNTLSTFGGPRSTPFRLAIITSGPTVHPRPDPEPGSCDQPSGTLTRLRNTFVDLLPFKPDLKAIFESEMLLAFGSSLETKRMREKMVEILLSKKDNQLFSDSRGDESDRVRIWVDLVTRLASPLSFASTVSLDTSFPETLSDLHLRSLLQTNKSLTTTVKFMLSWIALSRRPLTVSELAMAVAVAHPFLAGERDISSANAFSSSLEDTEDHKPVDFQNFITSTMGSVVRVSNNGHLRIHAEFAELLYPNQRDINHFTTDIAAHFALPDAHNILARVCLSLVHMCMTNYTGISVIDADGFGWDGVPLFTYAVIHWPYHHNMCSASHFSAPASLGDPPTASATSSSGPDFSSFFRDGPLLAYWAKCYFAVQSPGLEFPKEDLPITIAAKSGCIGLVRWMLEEKNRTLPTFSQVIHVTEAGKARALLAAVGEGYDEIAQLLQDHGSRSKYVAHAYVAASLQWRIQNKQAILDSVAVPDWRGHTPIHIACMTGDLLALEMLLETFQDNEHEVFGEKTRVMFDPLPAEEWDYSSVLYDPKHHLNPLHLACMFGHSEIVSRLLVGDLADPNALDSYGNTPFFYACLYEHKTVVQVLLGNSKTDPNMLQDERRERNIFHVLAFNGSTDILSLVVEMNQVKARAASLLLHKDAFILTPLHIASKLGHTGVAKLLLEVSTLQAARETDSPMATPSPAVLEPGTFSNVLPIHLAALRGYDAFVESLLDHGATKEQLEAVGDLDHVSGNALHVACRSGVSTRTIEVLTKAHVNNHISLDLYDSEFKTALHYAVAHDNLLAVNFLLGRGASPNCSDGNGVTPIMTAARGGSKRILDTMISGYSKEIPLDATDNDGKGILHHATLSGLIDVVEHVLDIIGQASSDAAMDQRPDARTSSFTSPTLRRFGHFLVDDASGITAIETSAETDLLLKLLPAVKLAKDPKGLYNKILLASAASGNFDNVNHLLQHCNADPNFKDSEGRTAFTFAAKNKNLAAVKSLAALTSPTTLTAGHTALSYAVESGSKRIAEAILSHGHRGEVDIPNESSVRPLLVAITKNKFRLVELLLQNGANTELPDPNDGRTPLHLAIRFAGLAIVKLVAARAGASMYAVDDFGDTPMRVAASNHFMDEIKCIRKAGWDLAKEKETGKESPLLLGSDWEPFVKLFVEEYGEDVNTVDESGNTALHVASAQIFDDASIFHLYIRLGADFLKTNHKGETPLRNLAGRQTFDIFKEVVEALGEKLFSDDRLKSSPNALGALDYAVQFQRSFTVEYLLDLESVHLHILSPAITNTSPVTLAVEAGFSQVTRLLLDAAKREVGSLSSESRSHAFGVLAQAVVSSPPHLDVSANAKRETLDYMCNVFSAGETAGAVSDTEDMGSHILLFDTIMSEDEFVRCSGHVFDALLVHPWSSIRDQNGWSFSELRSVLNVPEDDVYPEVSYPHKALGNVNDKDSGASSPRPYFSQAPRNLDSLKEARPGAPVFPSELARHRSHDVYEMEVLESSKGAKQRLRNASSSHAFNAQQLAIADRPIPPTAQYSYTVDIVFEPDDLEGRYAVGLGVRSTENSTLPGIPHGSCGLHSDDGGLYSGNYEAAATADIGEYGLRDKVGVHFDVAAHKVFFTVNGRVLNTGFKDVYGRMYPMVSLSQGCVAEISFPRESDKSGSDTWPDIDLVTTWVEFFQD